mmetsp:Transcript_3949/g.9602  ORF Transcript_3949/g.9602 Transcript_3949/m.9602 type:complete len:248 (+) Transcript_3949:86-829(+)
MLGSPGFQCAPVPEKHSIVWSDDDDIRGQVLEQLEGVQQCPFTNVAAELEDSLVCYIGEDSGAVDAERVGGVANVRSQEDRLDLQAHAVDPPVNIEIELAQGDCWQPGQPFRAWGPQGPICLEVPPDALPGSRLRYRLAPRPEYRVEVPPGAGPGWVVQFKKGNGEACQVVVPAGVLAGDTFEVTPPSLMVRIPENAQPGDFVRFSRTVCPEHSQKASRIEFFRARVPEGLRPCMYFTARLPPPSGC